MKQDTKHQIFAIALTAVIFGFGVLPLASQSTMPDAPHTPEVEYMRAIVCHASPAQIQRAKDRIDANGKASGNPLAMLAYSPKITLAIRQKSDEMTTLQRWRFCLTE